ncbi:MAG TPA: SpoIIE family protein phosphatase [Leptospiraceae bacterium]|nr:SpoIIE family protein phosphatase [Leptospiraceae bacterium]
MNFPMTKFISNILLFLFFALVSIQVSAKEFDIQVIDVTKEMEDLNTPPKEEHTWWVTSSEINPEVYTKYLLNQFKDKDKQDETWKPALVPGNPIGEKLISVDSQIIWYLKVFTIHNIPDEDQILYLKRISDRDETYLNGILIGKTGDWDSDKAQAYDKSRLYKIPKETLKVNSPNVLLIRVRKYFRDSVGVWGENVFLGGSKAVLRDYYFSILKPILFLICYFTVGAYFIFLFLRRRKDRENFYFGMFAILFVVYQLLRNQWRFEFGYSYYAYKKTEYAILMLLFPALYLFFRYYFVRTENKFIRYFHYFNLIPITILVSIFGYILFTSDINLWNDFLNQLVIPFLYPPLIFLIFVIIIYNGFIKNSIDAKIMFTGWLILIAGMISDILVHLEVIRFERTLEYSFFVFILSLAFILSNRFVRVHQEVEDLNLNLEKKVIHRTEELQTALTKVNELKLSQDGDYFLTYLLLEPLCVKAVTNQNIKVDFLISQKKKFVFHKNNHEIGGDTCIAHSIFLQHRPVTVFLNADAMGKSMQGAGGVLVLNSIFESIVKRTSLQPVFAEQSAESWLTNAFIELHNVFIMFEGSMMISLNMGIIDDVSGRMVYVNAEHPAIVLFRDENTSFLPLLEMNCKLGSPLMEERVYINSFLLADKDVLLLGSDGRDDIILSSGEMNNDYDLFLTHVKNARTDLKKIFTEILKTGEIYDDLSLLRIEYNKF